MRKTKKQLAALGLAVMLAASMSMTAFAGQWQQDTTGWWYQNDDGTYFNGGWQWIEGKCYYFTPEGYCLTNTTTPDGYTVDGSGAWIVNGMIQTQGEDIRAESGYNADGISNVAIDLLEHTRAENAARYDESNVNEIAGYYYVNYEKTKLLVEYYEPEGKPSRVSAKATDIFRDAPMTGSAYDDKDTLISNGYSAVTDGGITVVDCGRYECQLKGSLKSAEVYIKFSQTY